MDFDYLRYVADGHDKHTILHDLMSAYGSDVWNFVYSLTLRSDTSDDITQDTFTKVFEKLDTFRGEAAIKTWILSIARHTVIDYQRSAFVRRVLLVDYIFEYVKDAHPSAETQAVDLMVSNEVWKHVLTLPKKLREVLVLHAHHELSITEISKLLNLPLGTVKSRLHRARKRMNAIYEGVEGDEEVGVYENKST